MGLLLDFISLRKLFDCTITKFTAQPPYFPMSSLNFSTSWPSWKSFVATTYSTTHPPNHIIFSFTRVLIQHLYKLIHLMQIISENNFLSNHVMHTSRWKFF